MSKNHTVSQIKIKELLAPAEFSALYPLIKQLNPELSRKQYNTMLKQACADGYRCFGAYQGKKMVAACGIWIMTRFWCGKFMEIDNLVVDQNQRNAGIGKIVLDAVEAVAKREKCQMLLAASYAHNTASHRFYFREKYIIRGFVFTKEI